MIVQLLMSKRCLTAVADVIDVYYDEAPVFERKEGDKLGELHLYHGAVGFRDRYQLCEEPLHLRISTLVF